MRMFVDDVVVYSYSSVEMPKFSARFLAMTLTDELF